MAENIQTDNVPTDDLQVGTDSNELFVNQNTEDIQIEFKDKIWQFTIRELTWKETGDCDTAAIKVKVAGTKNKPVTSTALDMTAYNIAYLQKAIVKSPFPITPASFLRLDSKFGDLLVAAVIKDDIDDSKNLDVP